MDDFAQLLRSQLAKGASLEDALARLRLEGAYPVATIKALNQVLGISLGEAKIIFDASPTWAREAATGHSLHNEVIRALDDPKNGNGP